MNAEEPDFCSWWPDGAYAACCAAHDRAYEVVSPWSLGRINADRELAMCVYEATGGDWIMAGLIGAGVLVFGGLWLTLSRLVKRR